MFVKQNYFLNISQINVSILSNLVTYPQSPHAIYQDILTRDNGPFKYDISTLVWGGGVSPVLVFADEGAGGQPDITMLI